MFRLAEQFGGRLQVYCFLIYLYKIDRSYEPIRTSALALNSPLLRFMAAVAIKLL